MRTEHEHIWHYDILKRISLCLCGAQETDEERCNGPVLAEQYDGRFDLADLHQTLAPELASRVFAVLDGKLYEKSL